MEDPAGTAAPVRGRLSLQLEEALLVGLIGLSILGIGITDFSRNLALWYWLAMVPVFAAVSIWVGWKRARKLGDSVARILLTQLLHWAALLLAVYLIYLFQYTGRVNYADAGLVALLALALTTFLAGVHTDWRFCVLGIVLGMTAGAAALVEEFFWVLLLLAVFAGALIVFWKRHLERS